MRLSRHGRRIGNLLVEGDDAALIVSFDDAELSSFVTRNRDRSDGDVSLRVEVLREHLPHVHLVDMVATKNAHVFGMFIRDDVLRLVDSVGGALEPAFSGALLSRNGLDEVVEHGRKAPGSRDVFFERGALVLREHLDFVQSGVDEVRQNDVDDSVTSPERNRRFCAVVGEGSESSSFAAR